VSLLGKIGGIAKMLTGKSVTDLAIDEGAKGLRGLLAKRKAKQAAKRALRDELNREGKK
jgi:hypothetical protein